MPGKGNEGEGHQGLPGERKTYIRSGECGMCGSCCRTLKFFMSPTGKGVPESALEFFRARGLEIKKSEWTGQTFIIVPHRCPHLKEDGHLPGTYECDIHKSKPRDCKLQPIAPWSHEGLPCTYQWREIHGKFLGQGETENNTKADTADKKSE
jgi:Fe-S-cluster containining protein